MVTHPKTPILNCFYHLTLFYFLADSELSCLGNNIFCVWPNSFAPHS